MEATHEEMRKLLLGPSAVAGSSQPFVLTATPKPQKEVTHQLFEELKDPLQQRKVDEAVATTARIEVPILEVQLAQMPAPFVAPVTSLSAKGKKTKMEPMFKAASSEPSSQKPDNKKKEKKPMLEEEEEEESMAKDTGSSKESADSEEEPSIPPPEPTTKMGLRLTNKKKPPSIYKSPVPPKRSSKTPGKGKGSNKKPKGK